MTVCYGENKETSRRNISSFWSWLPQSELSVPWNSCLFLVAFKFGVALTKLLIGISFFLIFKDVELRAFSLTKTSCFRELEQGDGHCQWNLLCEGIRGGGRNADWLGWGLKHMIGYFLSFLFFCHLLEQGLLEYYNSLMNCRCHSSWNCIFCHSFPGLNLRIITDWSSLQGVENSNTQSQFWLKFGGASALLELWVTCVAFLNAHLGFHAQYHFACMSAFLN